MEFTGERYLPELDWPEMSYEHWHRYLFAGQFVEGKVVLDIACGEGYGSYYLSKSAHQIVGIDISEETITLASKKYVKDNLSFMTGSASHIPIKDNYLFDVIVSFETIEHIEESEQIVFLDEIKRLLKPDGIFIVSTPNKLVYSDRSNYTNQFHLKEFYVSEFEAFLHSSFKHVDLMGQKVEMGSYISGLEYEPKILSEYRLNFTENGFQPTNQHRDTPYIIAVCSNELRSFPNASFALDLSMKMLESRDKSINFLQSKTDEQSQLIINKDQQLEALDLQLTEKDQQLKDVSVQLIEKDQQLQDVSVQLTEKDQQLQDVSVQLIEKENMIQTLLAQMLSRDQEIQNLLLQIAYKNRDLHEISSSWVWKLNLSYRHIRDRVVPPNSWRRKTLSLFQKIILYPIMAIKKRQQTKKYLYLIKSSDLFDEKWYLVHNSDVADAKIDAARHYLLFGGFEGRDPSPRFNSSWYLNTYKDVQMANINPLVHFLKFGALEKRTILPDQANQVSASQAIPIKQPDQAQVAIVKSLRSNLGRAYFILKTYGPATLIRAMLQKARFVSTGLLNGQPQHSVISDSQATTLGVTESDVKKGFENNAKLNLDIFLKSNAILDLPSYAEPLVSVILLFQNRAELSLLCLGALQAGAGSIPFEVIIVDNASTDETSLLLDRIRNAKIIRNTSNNGFGGGCNQAVEVAIGKFLLFLNNDTELMPNSLEVMVKTISNGTNIGAVGGKLIFPNGRLQEAGSIIWRDGSCLSYGRYEDPFEPEFSYVRDVDFCSGALLLTPRDIFLSFGKFDSVYAPAYYEDADYCMQLWKNNLRVVFQPFSVAIHHEFGSSNAEKAISLQKRNREKFIQKWHTFLQKHDSFEQDRVVFSREHKTDSKRILFIDDVIPDYRLGSGYPRTYRILHSLADMGYKATFLPLQMPHLIPEIASSLQLKGIEVLYTCNNQRINIEEFIKSRPGYYDIAFVSRPHNMQEAITYLETFAPATAVIYDAEALFSIRDIKYKELNGVHVTENEVDNLVQAEVALVKDAHVVTTVSATEKQLFAKYGIAAVEILGHVIEPKPTPASFDERKDILFVGGILSHPSPNSDAVSYFVKKILPLVRKKVNCDLYIVGTNKVQAIWEMETDFIHIIGKVDDLTPYYNQCKLFVVPTRYSAGIPLKLLEAAAHGLPAVVTPLTASQIGWKENYEFLVGESPKDFATKVIELYSNKDTFNSLREHGLKRIREEYNEEMFKKNLLSIMELAKTRKESRDSNFLL